MYLYLIRRLLALIPVWLGISFLAFTLGDLAPGDAASTIYTMRTGQPPPNRQVIDELREELGLNDPFPVRFLNWTVQAFQGDFGNSYRSGQPVLDEMITKSGVTLQLAVGGLLIAVLIAIPTGILAAVFHNTFFDLATRILSLIGATIPAFWLSYMLILLFAVRWQLLPSFGYAGVENLIMPWLALGATGAAGMSRLLRSSMLEILGTDFIRTARAKGVPETGVVLRHAFRNALIPLVTLIGTFFGFLSAGAVVVVIVFSIPGLG
jgi:peptide/nickel transport system permease protein